MAKLAVLLRAKPGMADSLKHVIELVQGAAERGWEQEMVGNGLTQNTVWYSPGDNLFVLVVEARDPQEDFAALQDSDNPVARWVRDNVMSTTDFDPASMQPLELLYDWSADQTIDR